VRPASGIKIELVKGSIPRFFHLDEIEGDLTNGDAIRRVLHFVDLEDRCRGIATATISAPVKPSRSQGVVERRTGGFVEAGYKFAAVRHVQPDVPTSRGPRQPHREAHQLVVGVDPRSELKVPATCRRDHCIALCDVASLRAAFVDEACERECVYREGGDCEACD